MIRVDREWVDRQVETHGGCWWFASKILREPGWEVIDGSFHCLVSGVTKDEAEALADERNAAWATRRAPKTQDAPATHSSET